MRVWHLVRCCSKLRGDVGLDCMRGGIACTTAELTCAANLANEQDIYATPLWQNDISVSFRVCTDFRLSQRRDFDLQHM